MRVADSTKTIRNRAADALKAVLHQVSQVKLKDIDLRSQRPDLRIDILACVEVHGHCRTLVCKVRANGLPDHVRTALEEFQVDAAQFSPDVTRVLIAPYLSEEARAICGESKAGFLDLEGNARLELGDVFIGKRSLSKAGRRPVSSVTAPRSQNRSREDRFLSGQIAGAA